MLQLSSQSRVLAKHPYVCASCLASLGLHEALLANLAATTPLGIRQLTTAPAPSRRASRWQPKRASKKTASKAPKTPGPSDAKPAAAAAPVTPPESSWPPPSQTLRPTSLKDALNTLRTALEGREDKAGKKKKDAGPKKRLPTKDATGEQSSTSSDALKIARVESRTLALTPIAKRQPPVPALSYGLDRVLFNPGVYHLQDPRSRVFNFDPYLAAIMPIREFDFNALKQYVTSSKDTTLTEMAARSGKRYAGSTSSMTSMLSHFHFLLSAWRPVHPAHISRGFQVDSTNFTRISRAPAAIFLHWKDGTYAIDADKEFDSANVLSMLGKSMEKLLTLSKADFEKYRRGNSDLLTEAERSAPEPYHYTTLGDLMMRSQLDAHDPRLPGTGMFDLKTRAVISIRMDAKDFHKGLGYEIRHRIGQWESYEREYFDMVRSAFLKYSLQVRMGRMDGIFVAFHNTQRIFGFQYVPLPELDLALHGTENLALGDREFKLSLHLLNKVLDRATARWPRRSLQIHFETRPSDPPFMYIFAKPVEQEEIDAVQSRNKSQVEEFEREMMGIIHKEEGEEVQRRGEEKDEEKEEDEGREAQEVVEDEDGPDEDGRGGVRDMGSVAGDQEETSLDVWEDMMEKVEETLENDERGVNTVREAIEDALEQSGLLQMESSEESHRYLDALLEAVTSANEARESSESVVGDGDNGGESSSSSSPAEEEAGADASPSQQQQQQQQQHRPSLKDLIVRFAAKFQASSPAEQKPAAPNAEAAPPETPADSKDGDALSADSVKLREFESILSKMMKKSPESSSQDAASSEEKQQPQSSEEDGRGGGEQEARPAATSGPAGEETPAAETSTTPTGNGASEAAQSAGEKEQEQGPEVLGMVLTIRNRVDGKYVKRPERLTKNSSWTVEYSAEELPAQRAARIYEMVLARRRKALRQPDRDEQQDAWAQRFQNQLETYSRKGRLFREREDLKARARPVRVYGVPDGLGWSDVFTDEGGPAVPRPEKIVREE